jgi:pyrimidine operon attenuation protein/uracil phosphoribosyltransferase
MTTVEPLLDAMAEDLRLRLRGLGPHPAAMVGIHTGGVWIARELHRRLGLELELGELNISFYRDDFSRIGMHPQVRPSKLPVQIDERPIVLVDDVLYTGRTVRAALNEIFDFGRPSAVLLAVLVERPGRELPIEAQVVGTHMDIEPGQQVRLSGPEDLSLSIVEPDGVNG